MQYIAFDIVGNLHKNLNLIIHYCGILRLISFNMWMPNVIMLLQDISFSMKT